MTGCVPSSHCVSLCAENLRKSKEIFGECWRMSLGDTSVTRGEEHGGLTLPHGLVIAKIEEVCFFLISNGFFGCGVEDKSGKT